MTEKLKSGDLNAGHRQRLITRFMKGGFATMPEHEKLELMLFAAIARRDVKPLAKKLILRFGSLAAVLDAEAVELMEVEGVGERTAFQLRLYREAVALYLEQGQLARERICTGEVAADFARVKLGGSRSENFMAIFLDNRYRLIDYEVTQGTVNRAVVYPRNVAKRALELSASAVVITHNHPGGETQPSDEDIKVTLLVRDALKAVEVRLLDHLVVAKSGYTSLAAMGVLDE